MPPKAALKPGGPRRAQSSARGDGVASMATWGAGMRAGQSGGTQLLSTMGGASSATRTQGGQNANGRQVDPLKRFEDFCDRFPVDRPDTASAAATTHAPSGTRGRSAVTVEANDEPDAETVRVEREMQSRRAAKETAAKSYLVLKRHKVDEWAQLAEKHNRRLRRENEVLAKIATITQEAAMNNDERYEEAVAGLRAQLEYTALFRSDNSETMTFVREAIGDIRDRLDEIKETSERQVQLELSCMREDFERQVQQRVEELEAARASEQNTTDEWMRHSRELQQQLDGLLRDTDTAYERHKRLQREHQRLRIENDAQADDAVLLARQWSLVSGQHQRLKDRVQELELALAGSAEGGSAGSSERRSRSPPPASTEAIDVPSREHGDDDVTHANRLATALRRGQALLETERDNLERVRKSYVDALKQRTELEVYLRCAVLHHRQNLSTANVAERLSREAASGGWTSRGSGKQSGQPATTTASPVPTTFSADDRRIVVESMLSIPRVLELLYRAGTSQATDDGEGAIRADLVAIGAPKSTVESIATSTQRAPDPDNDGLNEANALSGEAKMPTETELQRLWDRWQQWTETADSALGTQAKQRKEQPTSSAAVYQ